MIPSGVRSRRASREPAEPPEMLFAGRLSPEKGILELVEAASGMKLVVAGDGPLREQVPGALGFVPHHALGALYERAAVVACPSHREGFGVVCAEAMAYGRPVVAGAVGGLLRPRGRRRDGSARPAARRVCAARGAGAASRRRGAPAPPGRRRPRANQGAVRVAGGHRCDDRGVRRGACRLRPAVVYGLLHAGLADRAEPRARRDSRRGDRAEPLRVRPALALPAPPHGRAATTTPCSRRSATRRRRASGRFSSSSATRTSTRSCAAGTRSASSPTSRSRRTPRPFAASGARISSPRSPPRPASPPRTRSEPRAPRRSSTPICSRRSCVKPLEGQEFAAALGEKAVPAATVEEAVAAWKRAKERGLRDRRPGARP